MEGLLLNLLVQLQVFSDDRDVLAVYVENEYLTLPFLVDARPFDLHSDIFWHIGHQPEVLKTDVVLLFRQADRYVTPWEVNLLEKMPQNSVKE